MSDKLFEQITEPDESGDVKCLKCGCQFPYDVHSEINLEWDKDKKHLTLVCPACDSGRPVCTCKEDGLDITEMCEPCRLDEQEKYIMKADAIRDEEKEEMFKK